LGDPKTLYSLGRFRTPKDNLTTAEKGDTKYLENKEEEEKKKKNNGNVRYKTGIVGWACVASDALLFSWRYSCSLRFSSSYFLIAS